MSEGIQLRIDGGWYDWDAHYLLVGYRYKKYTPFISYSRLDTVDMGDRTPLKDLANEFLDYNANQTIKALVEPLGLKVMEIYDGISYIMDQEQTTYAVGVRYDLTSRVALKAQFERAGDFNGTGGKFSSEDKLQRKPQDSIQVYSFVIDAVF